MQLGDLLDDVTLDMRACRIEVLDVQIDSRECGPGSLFFAVPGANVDGSAFARDAVARGAVAVVATNALALDVPVVVVPASQLDALVGHVSAAIVGHPEVGIELVGVTGTNGKTSVATMVSELAQALHWNGASVGTLTNERTTPAAPDLFRMMAQIVGDFDERLARSVVALEVSSHALAQRRVEGLDFAVAAFTNLSHDHLDYHGSMEEYFNAKARLFGPEHARRAVIWVDDAYGERLAATTTLPSSTVRRDDASNVDTTLTGTTFTWRDHVVVTSLVGDYNVDNALVAMAIISTLGAGDDQIAAAMSRVVGVPGRFEVVASGDVVVIVDFAHTPEGLRRLLSDVRRLTPHGRILTVFGAGGDRDRAKRPEMGSVVTSLSDLTIVTSDNPRSEIPDAIIDAIMSGVVSGAVVRREADRRRAIAAAIEFASPGDVVVIAGKGHETTQTIGDVVTEFDDRVVALELLR
jgi:UDP-N-acetylmuramoyl-L-alanyl-D-glutamate--2,6-diaminopimelate ligase